MRKRWPVLLILLLIAAGCGELPGTPPAQGPTTGPPPPSAPMPPTDTPIPYPLPPTVPYWLTPEAQPTAMAGPTPIVLGAEWAPEAEREVYVSTTVVVAPVGDGPGEIGYWEAPEAGRVWADRFTVDANGNIYICAILLLLYQPGTRAQIVSTPIPRHIVLHNAASYLTLKWYPDADSVATRTYCYPVCPAPAVTACYPYSSQFSAGPAVTAVAYKWGGGDSTSYFKQRIETSNDLAGDVNPNWHSTCPGYAQWKRTCPYARGVDCSGYVTRAWGLPVGVKWGTQDICDHSAAIPYDAGQRNDQLRRRMRMGDVFASCGNHVVMLHYLDPEQDDIPIYYEAQWASGVVMHNTSGGWT